MRRDHDSAFGTLGLCYRFFFLKNPLDFSSMRVYTVEPWNLKNCVSWLLDHLNDTTIFVTEKKDSNCIALCDRAITCVKKSFNKFDIHI